MNTGELKPLLAELLKRQVETDPDFVETTESELEDMLRTGRLMPEVERRLWSSPAVRARYTAVRMRLAQETMNTWRGLGFGTSVMMKAAASNDDLTTISAEGDGFEVTITRTGDPETPWTISIDLDPRACEAVLPGMVMTLMDDGGHVWMRGRLSDTGYMDAAWPATQESPNDRLLRHKLLLSFS